MLFYDVCILSLYSPYNDATVDGEINVYFYPCL